MRVIYQEVFQKRSCLNNRESRTRKRRRSNSGRGHLAQAGEELWGREARADCQGKDARELRRLPRRSLVKGGARGMQAKGFWQPRGSLGGCEGHTSADVGC